MLSITYLVVMILICGFAGLVVATREHQVADCISLVNRLYPGQLDGLDAIAHLDAAPDDVWVRSHGYKGLWRRWRNRAALVQLAQFRATMEPVPAGELEGILHIRAELTIATLMSAATSLVRVFFPKLAAEKNWLALRLYVNLAYTIHALYADDTAPLCASKLASIL